jgi:hypothetical protein
MAIMARPTDEENTPLLADSHAHHDDDDGNDYYDADDETSQTAPRQSLKQRTARLLASKPGHYCVLALVSLDIASIFAALILRLLAYEGRMRPKPGLQAEHVLDIAGICFSCLFFVELSARARLFGWAYFQSWFNCLDAIVIVLGLAVGVILEGALGEIASLVVVLRLLRVFTIIEEVGTGAEEKMVGLREQLGFLFKENESLREELMHLRAK